MERGTGFLLLEVQERVGASQYGSREGAAWGLGWGREELLLLRQGTHGGKRPASSTSLVCCVEGERVEGGAGRKDSRLGELGCGIFWTPWLGA